MRDRCGGIGHAAKVALASRQRTEGYGPPLIRCRLPVTVWPKGMRTSVVKGGEGVSTSGRSNVNRTAVGGPSADEQGTNRLSET